MNEKNYDALNPIVPRRMAASEGVKLATEMIKINKLVEVSGLSRSLVSSGMNHTMHNGKPSYYVESTVGKLQAALGSIADQLRTVKLTRESLTQEESPLCYGETIVDQLRTLREWANLPWIFQTYMGWTKKQQDIRLTDPRPHNRQHGQFSDAELEQMNDAVQSISVRLMFITLEVEKGEGR